MPRKRIKKKLARSIGAIILPTDEILVAQKKLKSMIKPKKKKKQKPKKRVKK